MIYSKLKNRGERNQLLDKIEFFVSLCQSIEELTLLWEELKTYRDVINQDDNNIKQICEGKQQIEQIFINKKQQLIEVLYENINSRIYK